MSDLIMRVGIFGLLLVSSAVSAQTALPPHVKNDGPQQSVIYTEQSGSLGSGNGAVKVKTCKAVCQPPAQSKPCRVEGNPARDGEFTARSWRALNAVTRYTETWGLAQDKSDICTLRLELLRILRIHTFDGTASTLIMVNLDRNEGERRVIPGKGPLAIDPEKGAWALSATGYVPVGTGRYAGYACRLLRKTTPDMVQEACLLDDTNAPASAAGLPVQLMPLADSTLNPSIPEGRIYSETQRVSFDATAPAAIFVPPANIRLRDVK